MVGRIYHVGLTVSDLDRSIAFYRDVLGLEFQGEIFMEGEEMSDGTLWEVLTALYFRWTCLPDCAVPELDADYRRNNRRLS